MLEIRRCSWTLAVALLASVTAGAEEAPLESVFARYARYGADIWAENPGARISGEGRACISCHTSLPYALVEPLLPGEYGAYDDLIDNVNDRILNWDTNTPWYSDEKLVKTAALSGMPAEILQEILDAEDSRGVEAIFNALIRAMHDAYSGSPVQPETRRAFENMWSAQVREGPAAGRWHWIQVNLVPWEVADSDVWGAALACVAAEIYPESSPPEQAQLLRTTLRQAASDEEVSLHTKSAILWCDAEAGQQLLDRETAGDIVAELLERQHDNGGWALRDLGPWTGWEGSTSDCCPQREVRPDTYATGVAALALARSHHLLSGEGLESMDRAVAWIDRQLANPYPAEPRHNRHETSDAEVPDFREGLYTNAGHMWAYLARTAHLNERAPWSAEPVQPMTSTRSAR